MTSRPSSDPNEILKLGFAHHQNGRLSEAQESYREVLKGNPNHGGALYLLGVLAYQTGHALQAIEILKRALTVPTDRPEVHNTLGLAFSTLDRHQEAEASFRRAIALSASADIHNNLGILLKKLGRLDEAIASYQQALSLDVHHADVRYNLGNAFRAKGDLEQAAACFRQVTESSPAHGNAFAALGQMLRALHQPQEALPMLRRAVELFPSDPELWCDLGDALADISDFPEATLAYKKAQQFNPNLARAWYATGCLFDRTKDYAAAMDAYRLALAIDPGWSEAHHNLGHALFELGQIDEALDQFTAAATGPRSELPRMMIAVIVPGSPKATNQTIFDIRSSWAAEALPVVPAIKNGPKPSRSPGRPLRIGYVSSFFEKDNWMKPVWSLINHHDRTRFEIHLFSDAPAWSILHGYHKDPRDHFHNSTALLNDALAKRIEAIGIDVLVDLNGYSQVRRLPLFGLRPAPVTVGWFNLFATTGCPGYDFLIGDADVIPPEEERFYSEKIARVPSSYLTFEVSYPVPDPAKPPFLENHFVTFGCLAPQYKITPQVIAAWAEILNAVPGSRLLLKNTALATAANQTFVRNLFRTHRVAQERLTLEGPADHYEFLETYSKIDIALDTFPYNGGTTTTEAIWQGLPVITFWGDRWVSRTSASLLRAAGLSQFVVHNLDAYVALAIETASMPAQLAQLTGLRSNMRAQVKKSKVCDSEAMARSMEQLYEQMFSAQTGT